jgi:hypothetical protein
MTFFESKVFVHVLYPMASLAVQSILAVIFNLRWWQAAAWHMLNSAFGGNKYINWLGAISAYSVAFCLHASAIGIIIQFIAEKVYKDIPYYNHDKRPKYTPEQRSKGHRVFFKNLQLSICSSNILFSSLEHPMDGHWPPAFSELGTSHTQPDPNGYLVGISGFLIKYVVLALLVQAGMVLADLFYGTFHYLQHKYRPFHKYSGHSYHHNFIYPLALCGPWLAPIDGAFSGLLSFILPVEILLGLFGGRALLGKLGCHWVQTFFFDTLLIGYVHEMNDYDHCGKQCPSYSGFPLCPPLGFLFGFHKSIANHEAHHNFSNCGFGILGPADWLMGTTGHPDMKAVAHAEKKE